MAGARPVVAADFLDQTGSLLGTATLTTSVLDATGLTTASLTPPAGASQVKLTLMAAPTLRKGHTTWVDDVWLW